MLKFKLYYDKDAEEAWLKKMSLNGWEFKKFFLGFYTFEPCKPGEYNYQIDLLDKKKASDGPFEMYTDVESKIAQYRRIGNLFKMLFIVEVICFLVDLIGAIDTGHQVFVICTVLFAAISLAMLRIAWKCKLKIDRFKREGM